MTDFNGWDAKRIEYVQDWIAQYWREVGIAERKGRDFDHAHYSQFFVRLLDDAMRAMSEEMGKGKGE